MAELILNIGGKRGRFRIAGVRTTIGSATDNDLVLALPGVQQRHACIHATSGGYAIENLSGCNAMSLNGEPLQNRRLLRSGDEIRIASAKLSFRHDQPFVDQPSDTLSEEKSVVVNCRCGTAYVLPVTFGGRRGKCKRCGHSLLIPIEPAQTGAATATPTPTKHPNESQQQQRQRSKTTCSICQSEFSADDPRITCEYCGLPFHEECWRDNLGCATYGCGNVGLLKQGPEIAIRVPIAPPIAAGTLGDDSPTSPAGEKSSWWSYAGYILAALVYCISQASLRRLNDEKRELPPRTRIELPAAPDEIDREPHAWGWKSLLPAAPAAVPPDERASIR
ncbi:MAG: FHA domain-containing protein [Pirellulales bacterium]